MMAAIFATMLLALLLDQSGRRALAIATLTICFTLAVWLFLFEIYSPDYGFRMPWLRT